MRNKIFVFILSFLFALSLFALTSCNVAGNKKYQITLQEGEFGQLLAKEQAEEGEKVVVEIGGNDYGVYSLFVNDKHIEGNSFTMPDCDVTVSAVLYSANTGAYQVNITGEEGGKTFANLISANQGDTITLKTYVDYNKAVDYYKVNGSAIQGNTFTMPNGEVIVETFYKEIMPATNLSLTVTQSWYDATSHWYASYNNTSVDFTIVVEDYIIYEFYDTKIGGNNFAMMDNIEFIFGPKNTSANTNTNQYYKIIASATGEYYWDRSNGSNGWSSAGTAVTIDIRKTDLLEDGFNGYIVNASIPYASIGLNYQSAYGNLVIMPSMRNTLGGLKSTWASYSEYNVSWGVPKTYVQIAGDGTFILEEEAIQTADKIFIGDSLLSNKAWKNFSVDTSLIGSTANYASVGRNIQYWKNNLNLIETVGAKEIILSCGTEELKTNSVLNTFGMVKELIDQIVETYPNKKLTIISSVPTTSAYSDSNKIMAYNSMVKDYIQTISGAGFIDFASSVYTENLVYKTLYSSNETLNSDGYLLLKRALLNYYGKYTMVGTSWGDTQTFTQEGSWTEGASIIATGTGETYYKQLVGTDFSISLNLTASQIYNGDEYPKFGIEIKNQNKAVYFYIDGSSGLSSSTVGIVEKINGEYSWGTSKEKSVNGLTYSQGNYATLKVEKVGNKVNFIVNGTVILSANFDYGQGSCTVGLFSFNTKVEFKDVNVTVSNKGV